MVRPLTPAASLLRCTPNLSTASYPTANNPKQLSDYQPVVLLWPRGQCTPSSPSFLFFPRFSSISLSKNIPGWASRLASLQQDTMTNHRGVLSDLAVSSLLRLFI
ncbi:uncharacterized protein BO80DRAFT_95097 [Aspergillus ibericus CBS 121593]|uniref:Uncharacterized protein n=1 Tax=Aspergillus ibericus CBS 121593 TaxID=1448316 RepID=A0A395GYK1_9EURO|nr:hypothetical protein BO80DRAFT_95097 [Aspergillus ibericus CBS 121593]RAL00671.1 hypothetical protein BO80DRAFT_95097 [Aspergillus ibericus CBS 121593]